MTADSLRTFSVKQRFLLLAGTASCLVLPVLLLALAAGWVCPDGACRVTDLDRQVLAAFHALRGPGLDVFFEGVTWLGSVLVLVPLGLGMAWRIRHRPGDAARFFLSLVGAGLLAFATKPLVARPRPDLFPFAPLPEDLSFPSGHAMLVTAFALGWLLFAKERRGWADVAAGVALIAAVAASRLYLQVHFPTDVAAGVLAATAWVLSLQWLPRAAVKPDGSK
ncbi:MAG TPA: phosphatase PAP2 family protein [Rhodocyclaceae bacterium]|nr:phosphatase PAP2 family protein [Rhodocyclaceae bacterium]